MGHETDFTIADFVADLRAPTPSAAAELAVADVEDVKMKILNYQNRFKLALKKKVEFMRLKYEKCMSSRVFKEPLQRINEYYMKIDILVKAMEHSAITKLNESKSVASKIIGKLDALSPLKTLCRGYCIAQIDNKSVKTAKELNSGDRIELRFSDGNKNAQII